MLILFDNGTPAPLRHALTGHTVVEAIERGWDRLVNGELIAAAEEAGFDLILTTDKNIRYQQNIGRPEDFVCSPRQSAMAYVAPLRRQGCSRRKRSHAWQLFQSGYPVRRTRSRLEKRTRLRMRSSHNHRRRNLHRPHMIVRHVMHSDPQDVLARGRKIDLLLHLHPTAQDRLIGIGS
jgi:hypothetical protein